MEHSLVLRPPVQSESGDETRRDCQLILKFNGVLFVNFFYCPAESLDKDSIKQQVEKLEEKFCDLVDCTYKALLERKVDDMRLFRSIFLSLDVSRKHEHREFIHDHLMKMDKETTFDDLWMRLADYCNFMNFDLLEHVVRRFAIEDLKQKMKSYEHDLQSFRKATRLCDFIDCWPVRGEPSLGTQLDLREFIAKMRHDWDSCTLEDLEKLKGVITHKFFLPEFALQLRKIKKGCITIIWLIPAPFMKVLQEAIETTSSEFFMEHKIETINIDGKDCYSSPTGKSVDYPKVQYTTQSMAQSRQTEIPSVGMLSEKLHSFKAGVSGELLLKETRRMRLAEEIISIKATSTVPSKQKYSILPQTTPTKHTRKLQQTSYIPALEFDPAEIYFGETLLSSNPRSGYSRALVPPTPAEKYVREKCVDEISEQVKLLPSVEQYLNKAEVEANPSLPTKYKDYLSSTPAIRAALYTTFNAKMAAELFTWSHLTESPHPNTMTELFTAFTLKTLVNHLSTHPVYHKQQLKITTFSDLPMDVYKQFQGQCAMAYEGVLKRQQFVFSAAQLPTEFAPLGLMQEVPQLCTEGRASYVFIHSTLQEYLAAVHISQLQTHEQTRLVQDYLNGGHFKMTLRFLAGLTKLANIPPDITRRLMEKDDTQLTYFHCLFEAKAISVATSTLGSDKMDVSPHYFWTPLDYYVTGHTISHSNCSWRLNFLFSSIDDDNLELFCQGCAAPGATGCRGHISYANFGNNKFTSKSITSFIDIPLHILQHMRVLYLNDNKLDGSACDLLAKAIPLVSKVENFWLQHNPIGSGGAVEVIKALCGSGVKELWLYNTGIGEPDCEALCELLKSSHSLQRLDIHQNNLCSESVASIINGLSRNSSLTTINISNSHFSMANVNSLASILKDQSKCTLSALVLRDCHISGDNACELAAALCENSTLKCFYLDHNPIGVKGASSMSDMLRHNKSLEHLYLCDDSLGEEGVYQLINSLKHNQTMRRLWLSEKYKTKTSDHRIHWRDW